jgi:hypothetical protein
MESQRFVIADVQEFPFSKILSIQFIQVTKREKLKNAIFTDLPTKSILKRKRSIEATSDSYLSNDSMSYKDTVNGKEIDDDESINEDEQSPDGKRKKKARTTFTGRQIFELEKQFEVKKYLSSSERSEMAKLLNVTETQVR